MNRLTKATAVVLAGALLGTACADDPAPTTDATDAVVVPAADTRAIVVERGVVRCGIVGGREGFALSDGDGAMEGFDADHCRAIAAAVLGDATKVDFLEVTEQEQFTTLNSKTVDVLLGVPTTATGDGVESVTFATPTFYDGQGVMVLEGSEILELANLEGLTVCVLSGDATDEDGTAVLAARGISVTPLPHPDENRLMPSFETGECAAAMGNRARLGQLRANATSSIRILPATLTRRPLAPATREDDAEWSQIVDWTIQGMLLADELGITSANVASLTESTDPAIVRLLGLGDDEHPAFDAGLGLPDTWAQAVIGQVGNAAEVYAAHLGTSSALGLSRAGSVNDLWTRGGQHYPWPYR